jgi:ABC-type Fe3+ transport system substrate-binding protein
MADDNVHWLRDTYGPALRAFYAELLREPVPQKFKDLLTALAEGKAAPDPGAGQDAIQSAIQSALAQPQEPVDASD